MTLSFEELLTFARASLPVSLVDVDVPGEAEVWDLAELPLSHQHVPGRQVTVHQLQQETFCLVWFGNPSCSVSRWRPHKVDKRMVLEYTHGLFIT